MTDIPEDLKKFTVLVVADTSANLILMNDLVNPFYTVGVATSGVLALLTQSINTLKRWRWITYPAEQMVLSIKMRRGRLPNGPFFG